MKIERLVIILFTIAGVVGGIASDLLADLILSAAIPLVVYVALLTVMLKFFEKKKRKWLIYNSLTTFILIWLVVWILLYNLR